MLFVVIDSDGTLYGVFTSRPKAEECRLLVYKYHGIDPYGDFFGWWVKIDAFVEDEPIARITASEEG